MYVWGIQREDTFSEDGGFDSWVGEYRIRSDLSVFLVCEQDPMSDRRGNSCQEKSDGTSALQ